MRLFVVLGLIFLIPALAIAAPAADVLEKAQKGDARAEYQLGRDALDTDAATAAKWLRAAAEQGYAPAAMKLGALFGAGQGVQKSYVAAYFWIRVANKMQKKPGAAGLAQEKEAARHLTKKQLAATERRVKKWRPESPQAPDIKPPSPAAAAAATTEKSIEYYKKVAEGGDPVAQDHLGFLYEQKSDYENAMKWFLKAAEAGNTSTQAYIGSLYRQGKHVARDYRAAYFWLTLATDRSNPENLNKKLRDLLYEERNEASSHLTVAQITALQKQVHDWQPGRAMQGG